MASWQRLPEENATFSLEAAAALAYGASSSAFLVAAPGTQALISLLPLLFPAQSVGILDFTYSEHASCWSRAGASVDIVRSIDELGDFDNAVIVNPNNPDGRLVEPGALLALSSRLAGRGGRLIVDEAFVDLLRQTASVVPVLPETGLIVLRSFGKTYGLAGLRLGFAVAGAADAAVIRQALGPWPVSGAAIEIGIRALSDIAWLSAARTRADGGAARLDDILRLAGFTPAGGTPLFRWARSEDAHEAFLALAQRGILVRAFHHERRSLRFGIPSEERIWLSLAWRMASLRL